MNSAAEAQRLFFALWPDEATREALRRATRRAVRGSGGRPVDPADLHMTLIFLGNVASDRFQPILAAAADAAAGPFTLCLDTVGFWAGPRVLWFGATHTPPPLQILLKRLSAALQPLGFEPDPRPYRPHVTLARKVSRPGPAEARSPVSWAVSEFVLVRSVTARDGARYTPLAHWQL